MTNKLKLSVYIDPERLLAGYQHLNLPETTVDDILSKTNNGELLVDVEALKQDFHHSNEFEEMGELEEYLLSLAMFGLEKDKIYELYGK